MARVLIACTLGALCGLTAAAVNEVLSRANGLPLSVHLAVILLSLGVAPLPGLIVADAAKPLDTLGRAILVAVCVLLGASATAGPSFFTALPWFGLYGGFEFVLVSLPLFLLYRYMKYSE